MMIEDCSFSESLVTTYTSYKNGGRDREKLTPEQFSTAFVLESEFLMTAVYYFAEFMASLECGESFDCFSSPAHVIDGVEFCDLGAIASVFLESRLQETTPIANELVEALKNEVLENGAE